MTRLLIVLAIAGCSSKSNEAAPAPGSATPRATPDRVRPPEPPIPPGEPCPAPIAIDCDRLVPAELRETYLAGKQMVKNDRGECTAGDEGFGITVSVTAATPESVVKIQERLDRIENLGRVAASLVGDKVAFLASSVDCEIVVQVPNKLDKATGFARALDKTFSKDTVIAP